MATTTDLSSIKLPELKVGVETNSIIMIGTMVLVLIILGIFLSVYIKKALA